jgi:hypothetical protein
MVDEAKHQFTNILFMEVFMLGLWFIWKQMNDFIFNRGRPDFWQWKLGFLEEAYLHAYRMNLTKQTLFISFLNLFS